MMGLSFRIAEAALDVKTNNMAPDIICPPQATVGMVKIICSIAMFLLIIHPTYIPHRFVIWDFRFWI